MKLQILRPCHDTEGLYIDSRLVLDGHTLYVEDVLNKIAEALNSTTGPRLIVSVESFDAGEYFEDDPDFKFDKDGSDWYKGKAFWNYETGLPLEWPF